MDKTNVILILRLLAILWTMAISITFIITGGTVYGLLMLVVFIIQIEFYTDLFVYSKSLEESYWRGVKDGSKIMGDIE
ncbi:hypothetical protein [Abyssicoccus albus]|uniref:Uncharacterized protein n=1 Tax=Abyssicoccus albus TaxID=1817405 RepID=A0A3N5BCQ2_9BACL|nr:hypothetical protein [Abyssicoccus albus]RPF54789.1 hypothetical protein EDD62_1750 [Abyssicoccus albus]